MKEARLSIEEYFDLIEKKNKELAWAEVIDASNQIISILRPKVTRGDATELEQRYFIGALNSLTVTYGIIGEYQKAVKCAKRALRHSHAANLTPVEVYLGYSILARAQKSAKMFDDAHRSLIKGIVSFLTPKDTEFLRCTMMDLSELYKRMDKTESSESIQQVAKDIQASKRIARRSAK